MEPTDIGRHDRPGHSSAHWFATCKAGTTFTFHAPPGEFSVAAAWNPDTNKAYNKSNSTGSGSCDDGTTIKQVEQRQERGITTTYVSPLWPAPMSSACTVTITLPTPAPLFLFSVIEAPRLEIDGTLET
jgi:hypothetical protein